MVRPIRTLHLLQSSPEGLSPGEAAARLVRHGPNSIRRVERSSLPRLLLAPFVHLMALLLWGGGLVAFLAGMRQLAVAIWVVNLLNGAFSFWQEFRAHAAVAALRRVLPQKASVVRGGREVAVPVEEVVPGDILVVVEGERIAADARLLGAERLRVDESTLTGEGRSVPKDAEAPASPDASDRILVFGGTVVVTGRGRGVVFATGMGTRLGKIAHLTQSVPEEMSPLQKELVVVSRVVTLIAVGVGAVFFLLAWLLAGVPAAQGLLFALGMIVAFVPEGLLPTVTLALALGVQRMAKRNALVKKLSAVETLGCATVILTDKTGTLTENQMTATRLWVAGQTLVVSGGGYDPAGAITSDEEKAEGAEKVAAAGLPPELQELLVAGALCNDARLVPPAPPTGGEGGQGWTAKGEPIEAALLVLAGKGGVVVEEAARAFPRVAEIPFDPIRMRMSTVHGQSEGGWKAFVKGAPAELLALCPALDAKTRAEAQSALDGFARQGLRVIGVASRDGEGASPPVKGDDLLERELTFLGLVAMEDPPRPEVADAVRRAHGAGIRIIMVTGDYGLTAASISRRIGIVRGDEARVITGADLARTADAELTELLRGEPIFARVTAEDKLRLVTVLQRAGEVVAVTGDGVNDAPALKKADIGVAMGRSGTDVAREAADMVLTDDNFASIVAAIEEGRAVYANIRKFITYIFTSNVPEAVPFIVFAFSGGLIPPALTVMQILAIDLGTDIVPALGLGSEPAEPRQMLAPPRDRKKHLIDGGLLVRAYLWLGLFQAALVMAAFLFALCAQHLPYPQATGFALAMVVATQMGNLFSQRSERSSALRRSWFGNPLLWCGAGSALFILLALLYLPPLQRLFDTAPFPSGNWLLLVAATPLMFLWDEARKAFLRRHERGEAAPDPPAPDTRPLACPVPRSP